MENQTGKTMKYRVVHDMEDLTFINKNRRINKKRTISLNCCGFDIETTNLIERDSENNIKSAFSVMYHWQFCINDTVFLGRTWSELITFFNWLDKQTKTKIIIWVANLGFEMSFLSAHFTIKKCFAKTAWKPMYFTILNHLEFHDCLQVTGGNLEFLAKNYCSPWNQKLKGDLDFTKIRNSKTPLNETERNYCINDVTILSEFAGYIFKTYRDIPLTKTGILRNIIKNDFDKLSDDCHEYIKNLMPDQAEYNDDMKFLFQGGFTHANFYAVNQKFNDVTGLDIKSSYPAVMLQEYFPMTVFMPIELETDGHVITDVRLTTKCVKFTAVFTGVRARYSHTILSEHKLINIEIKNNDENFILPANPIYDNGRLMQADAIMVKMTEIDYDIFSKFYTWKKCEVHDAKCAERAPLPDYLTDTLKKYYMIKERKKDSSEYMLAKQSVNSFYGMCVTKIIQKELIFNNDGKKFELTENVKPWYKITKNQFLSPYWGVWVTAHARKRLLDMIYAITKNSDGFSDVLYSDTDSIYVCNYEKHKPIIDEFNAKIREKNKPLGEFFETLGTFDDEGTYDFFKTLGSKRYMKQKKCIITATIAGVDGDRYCRTIPKTNDPFVFFDFKQTRYLDMTISGKKGHHYFYTPDKTVIVDDGENAVEMPCFSGCAIYDIPFAITVKKTWVDMLAKFTDRGII